MKRLFANLLTATMFVASFAPIRLAANRADSASQTQGEMNMAASRAYHKADAVLNRAYKRLVNGLDPTPRARLVKAQKAWIAFRDAEASFRASEFEGGTAEPAAYWAI